jgi:arylsulfatase A-like enzyme
MTSRRTFLSRAAGAAALSALPHFAISQQPQARKPNIIFILADDLGYGDVGCYGQRKIKTPNIDRLAAEGLRFTQAYAGSPVCAPSRCVLMTGLHAGHCYIRGNSKQNLRPDDVTVAEVLKQAGYTTGLCGKWGLGHEGSTGLPTKKGFDHFFGYLDQTHAHNYYPTFLLKDEQRIQLRNVVPEEGKVGQGVASKKLDYSHDLIAEDALSFIDQNKDKPFFLYAAFTLPHANNEAKQDGMEVPDVGEYANENWPERQKQHAAMISRLDRDIGRIMDRLRKHDIDDNTIVFFTSDNGPHKEGGNDPDFADSNGPLRGIKRALYEGGIRVPFIARWPNHIKPNTTTDFPTMFHDFLPTAAALAGTTAPTTIDGQSILPTLRAQSQQPPQALYWEFHEGGFHQAARMGNWKAVRNAPKAPLELYDLSKDLAETNDVAREHPDIVKKMDQYLASARTDSEHWPIREPNPRRAPVQTKRN